MRPNASTTRSLLALAAVGMLGLGGCNLDVPDLNNPGIDELEENPTAAGVAAACTGLLIGARAATSAANGYISQLGIVGRESYNFDNADPRFINELLEGTLSPASPFGGAFWAFQYSNMRMGDIIQNAKEGVVPEFEDSQKSAISGFVKTIRALDLDRVIVTHDVIGGVIDTDHPITEVTPVVSKDEVLAEMARLLDEAATELEAGGDAFPFPLSSGFDGFDTPATFLTFNRALRARTAAYQATTVPGEVDVDQYETLLDVIADSFIDDSADSVDELEDGVYHSFGTGVGDTTNALINVNIYAHPSIVDDAVDGDARLTRNVRTVSPPGLAQELTSDLKFNRYTSPSDPVTIIRNEELILLRAEAEWFTGDVAAAQADLDLIRTVSGGLAALPAPLADDDAFVDELLYNRRYSLLFEGHRLIDMRRFDRIEELPLDKPTFVRNVRWPLPSAECDARPGEAACAIDSNEPVPQ